ncbi:MAG: hypothetical protein PW788_03620 [Micavibrio sp.]|nr:hypothetical protein [Micavibrio sp.]
MTRAPLTSAFDAKAAAPPVAGSIAPATESPSRLPLTQLKAIVAANGPAVAALGNWAPYINVSSSLAGRVPQNDVDRGFDAGVACALGLLPAHAQKLVATLHAAYTPEAITQVRQEISTEDGSARVRDANSATAWWLAACSLCGDHTAASRYSFRGQVKSFEELAKNPQQRLEAANIALRDMLADFDVSRGFAYGEKDGCQQGAYIAGHSFAVMYAPKSKIYFIGTYQPTLGLEDFAFGDAVDEKGRAKSGPVHNSRQFVKCADRDEMKRAVAVILKNPALAPQAYNKQAGQPAARKAAQGLKP